MKWAPSSDEPGETRGERAHVRGAWRPVRCLRSRPMPERPCFERDEGQRAPVKLGWKGALGLILSAVLVWWTLSGVDLGEVWTVVRTGNLWLLGASVLVATSGFGIRALRWHVLLQPVKPDTTFRSRFGAVTIGFMANNLLPARVGEFVRVYALSRVEAVPLSGVFGSLVVERFLDGLVLMAFFVLPMALPGFPGAGLMSDGMTGTMLRGMATVLAGLIVAFTVLLIWPERVTTVVGRAFARLPGDVGRRATDALAAFLDALDVLRRPALLVPAVLWSVGFWTWHGFSFYLGMLAFGINEGFLAAIFTEAAVGFGVALPSAPGFFGTFHFAADWALSSVYGVDNARSLAFAYGYHLGGFFPVTIIGLWYARRLGISLREMTVSEEKVEADVERVHDLPPELRSEPPARTIELDAPAKVNLHLRVLDREPSGFHRIETLIQTLEFADRVRIELTPGEGYSVAVKGFDVGPDEENLALRAARAFVAEHGAPLGVHIRLEKRIPPGSGLGGGSSDAASVLIGLDALLPGRLTRARLLAIGEGLGSDVPFFLSGSSLAEARGRGEVLTALPPLPSAPLIVALPEVHVSTAEAYRELDRVRVERGWESGPPGEPLRLPDWAQVRSLGVNDFEPVILTRHPELAGVREALAATGPLLALLSGSGSALFALYETDAQADRAMLLLESRGGAVFVRTRTRV